MLGDNQPGEATMRAKTLIAIVATTALFTAVALTFLPSSPLTADDVSVERGLYVSIIGGCHDCHTENYVLSEGKIDPSKAMKGSSIGWRGTWGTTYPANLRLLASTMDEAHFVIYMKTLQAVPPMSSFNMNAMHESDLRSLYRYVKSLGEPGEPAPSSVWQGEPKTPYITIDPPTKPKS